jgi:hypothetical protein
MRPWNYQDKAIAREKKIVAFFNKKPLTVEKVANEARVWAIFLLGVFILVLALGGLSLWVLNRPTPPAAPAASVVPASAHS